MISLICILIIINALFIIGLYHATDYESYDGVNVIESSKMILWKVRYYLKKKLGDFYSKPFISCPVCMASVHSLYFFWPIAISQIGFEWWLIPAYLVYVPVLSGLIYVLESKL